MNYKLMEEVAEYIEEHPERYNQGEWCGTACCVAGTTICLQKGITGEELREKLENRRGTVDGLAGIYVGYSVPQAAAEYLGISDRISCKLFALLPGCNWPKKFAKRWLRADLPEKRARVAASYMRYLVYEHKRKNK